MGAAQRIPIRDPKPPLRAAGEAAASAPWPRLADLSADVPHTALPICWTLTEGAAGMVSQVHGLAQAVGYPETHHKVEMRRPFSAMWPGFLPPWSGVFRDPSLVCPDAPPRLVISCGRLGSAASIALKRRFRSRVFTVHIQDPKLPKRWFDLIVTPSHDGLTGANVVHSLGAVHHVTQARLEAAREQGLTPELTQLGQPFVGVLLGGPNRYYGYTAADVRRLIEHLRTAVKRDGVKLAIVPSRRTPQPVLTEFLSAFGRDHCVWEGQGDNPYITVLAHADKLIVTGDSVSMVSEAAATCRPLHVFHLTEQRSARRFRLFHQSFETAGVSRPFTGRLEHWTYASPDRTGLIATLIREHLR